MIPAAAKHHLPLWVWVLIYLSVVIPFFVWLIRRVDAQEREDRLRAECKRLYFDQRKEYDDAYDRYLYDMQHGPEVYRDED